MTANEQRMTELEDVAAVLLREGLHVSALALNSELHRTKGRELKTIRDFFSNSTSKSSLHPVIGSSSNSMTGRRNNSPSQFMDSEYMSAMPHPRLSSVSPQKVASSLTSASIGSGNNASVLGSTRHKRSPSIQTFDSLDFARGSDDGIEKSMDRIAVLEFELRKAKETIKSLRTSLTIATIESTTDSSGRNRTPAASSDPESRGSQDQAERQQLESQGRRILNENQEKDEESNQVNAVPGSTVRAPNESTVVDGDNNANNSRIASSTTMPHSLTSPIDTSITGAAAAGASLADTLLAQVKDMDAACKPHEKRAVNFLIHEFLMRNKNRMTAISLSEEVSDQDFENWEDVGLNTQKPPQLLHLYRFFLWSLNHANKWGSSCTSCRTGRRSSFERSVRQDAETQTTLGPEMGWSDEQDDGSVSGGEAGSPFPAIDRRASDVDARLEMQENPVLEFAVRVDQETQTDKLLAFFKRSSGDEVDGESGDGRRNEDAAANALGSRLQLSQFQRVFVEESGILASDEMHFEMIKDRSHLIQLLAYDFPQIVLNYKPDQRSDLIPILISTIYASQDHETRAALLNSFFNLIEKPNHCERRMILSAFVSLAKELSVKDVEEDLLPLIWEQINHKSVERRILVTESCAELIPLVSSGIRVSLIYSILSQILMQETDLHVKEAAVKVLSFLLTIFTSEQNDDKFDPVLRQILIPTITELERVTSLSLSQEDVIMKSVSSFRKSVIKFLIPCLCYWSFRLNRMFTLTSELLSHMKQILESSRSHDPPPQENAAVMFMNSLEIAIPFLFVSLIQSMPISSSPSSESVAPAVAASSSVLTSPKNESHRFCFISNKLLNMNLISSQEPIKELISRFDQYISRDWFKPWPVWEEMFEKSFLPVIVNEVIPSISLDQKNLLSACINFCSSFGQHFGLSVIRSKAKPMFLKNIYMTMNELNNALLPAFASLLISIKPIQEQEKSDLTNCLAKSLIHLSMESSGSLTVTSSSSSSSGVQQQPASGSTFSTPSSSSTAVLHATSVPVSAAQCVRSIEITINYLVTESHSELTRSDINRCILQFLQETGSHDHLHVKKNSCRILNSFIVSNIEVQMGTNGFSELLHDLLHTDCILHKLSLDPDLEVRALTIPSFGSIYVLMHEQLNRIKGFDESDVKRLVDRVNEKLDFFLEDAVNRDQHLIHLHLISIFARIARSCSCINNDSVTLTARSFLDFSLPRMAALTVQTRSNVTLSKSKKQEIVLALIDAYTKFSFIPIGVNDQLIRESITPSLKLMREEVLDVAPEYEDTIIALMSEFEKKMPAHEVSASGIESLISKSMSLHRLKHRESVSSAAVTSSGHHHHMSPHSQPSTPSTGASPIIANVSAVAPVMDDLKTRFKGFFKK